MLRYLHTRNGYSRDERISLCQSGHFIRSYNASSMSVNGTLGMGDANSGQWRVEGTSLLLAARDGSSARFSLVDQGSQFLLNGARYFLTNESACQ